MEEVKTKRMAILYSEAKREDFPTEEQFITEEEVYGRAKRVAPYFEKLGYKVDMLPGNSELTNSLRKRDKFDFVLNLVDSVRGKEYLAPVIPATLELLNIPYIGTGMLGLAINSNKFLTKKLLEQAGLPLPRYQLFNSSNDALDAHLKFPLISKLNEIHGSVAITQDAVSENESHLRARIKTLMNIYRQPMLVEEFIAGRELTVFVLEGAVRKVYVAEKIFPETGERYKMATFESVWELINPHKEVRADGHGLLEQYARTAVEVLKMDDYSKFDVRMDESGRYYFIDCNANPSFGPVETYCQVSTVLQLFGIDFEEILRRLIMNVNRDEHHDLALTAAGNGNVNINGNGNLPIHHKV